jgi:hypothetical protein
MSSLSPLTKNCPQCRAILTAETVYCACGYRFESDTAEERPSSELVARAEALYELHLRARLQRGLRAARFAKVDVLRDPHSPVKTAQLQEAEKEIKLLKIQVTIQSKRADAARRRAESALAQTTPATAEAAETFRAAQTIKAEQTFELLQLQRALERLRSTQANGIFEAVQAEKARAVAERTNAVQACPGCGNTVTAGTTRCDCGYVLSSTGTDAAAGFLTAEELAALRNHS